MLLRCSTEGKIAIVVIQAEISCRSFIDHCVVELISISAITVWITVHRSSTATRKFP